MADLSPQALRRTLRGVPTGIALIAATIDDRAVGMLADSLHLRLAEPAPGVDQLRSRVNHLARPLPGRPPGHLAARSPGP
ncbi:hypothetical protein QP028_05440 [Corynebacterium suedekumii]|nr:hypothetical protein QP028_05440 [Corynebacterium suedekumii]